MNRSWIRTALLNFLIAAVIGALLRFAFVVELPWMDYRHWLHAHSHVAMLGWVYLALFSFLVPAFLSEAQARKPIYKRLFWLTQLSVLGMLFSFPVQGYGPVSIAFSTLHMILAYLFAYRFWKDSRERSWKMSTTLVHLSLAFMLFSSLGLWAMGVVMAFDLRNTEWYYLSVQFFLHFQFYGWFGLAVFGLFFRWMENRGIQLPERHSNLFIFLLAVSVLLSFALPVTWAFPQTLFFIINSAGVLLQLAALVVFIRLLWPYRQQLFDLLPRWPLRLFGFAFGAWALKVLIQSSTVIPVMSTIGYTIRNFTIGFVHLFLLGTVSAFLIGYAFYHQVFGKNIRLAISGAVLLLVGIALSEAILFTQGFMFWGAMGFLPGYYEVLFSVSLLMPLGVAFLFAGLFGQRRQQATSN